MYQSGTSVFVETYAEEINFFVLPSSSQFSFYVLLIMTYFYAHLSRGHWKECYGFVWLI